MRAPRNVKQFPSVFFEITTNTFPFRLFSNDAHYNSTRKYWLSWFCLLFWLPQCCIYSWCCSPRFRRESRKMNKCFRQMYSRNFSSNYNNSAFCLQGVLKADFSPPSFSGINSAASYPSIQAFSTTQGGKIFQRCISHIIRVESQLKVFANILNLPPLLLLLHCLCPSPFSIGLGWRVGTSR